MRSLHYAVVALGTPNVTFLVALDTGSDLFWVPCDCINCAPLVSPNYGVLLLLLLLPLASTPPFVMIATELDLLLY